MPSLRQAGGPGKTPFRFTWNGGRILREITEAAEIAMGKKADKISARLERELHRDTGEMAEKSFAFVDTRGGDNRITLVAGSYAEHTMWHELGTAHFVGHPQITQIMQEEAPTLMPAVRAALNRGRR